MVRVSEVRARASFLNRSRSSMLIATTWTLSFPATFWMPSSMGSSFMHGPHHEAQNVTTNTLPANCVVSMPCPSRVMPSEAGGVSPQDGIFAALAQMEMQSRTQEPQILGDVIGGEGATDWRR